MAIDETNRRREIQQAYNREHGIDPQPLRKKIADITDVLAREEEDTRELLQQRDWPYAGHLQRFPGAHQAGPCSLTATFALWTTPAQR